MKMLLGISGLCAVVSMLLGGFSKDRFVFEKPMENSILISKDGTGKGTVRVESYGKVCGIQCTEPVNLSIEEGSVITVIAMPDHHSEFNGWSGGCRGRSRECTVIVGSNTKVTAKFHSR